MLRVGFPFPNSEKSVSSVQGFVAEPSAHENQFRSHNIGNRKQQQSKKIKCWGPSIIRISTFQHHMKFTKRQRDRCSFVISSILALHLHEVTITRNQSQRLENRNQLWKTTCYHSDHIISYTIGLKIQPRSLKFEFLATLLHGWLRKLIQPSQIERKNPHYIEESRTLTPYM